MIDELPGIDKDILFFVLTVLPFGYEKRTEGPVKIGTFGGTWEAGMTECEHPESAKGSDFGSCKT